MRRLRVLVGLAAVGIAAGLAAPAIPFQSERPVVTSAASLPRLTYRLPMLPSRLIADPQAMAALAGEVERSSARLLEQYDIRDAATRRDLNAARRAAALVQGDLAAALAFDRASQGAAAEPGLATGLLVTVLTATAGSQGAQRLTAARAALRSRLDALGAEKRDQIVSLRRELALASSAYRLGEISAFADADWRRNPEVGQDFAVAMLRLWVEINLRNPLLDAYEIEFARWLDRHPDRGLNVWPSRDLGAETRPVAPVVVAVWDAVDPGVFPGRVEGLAFDERFAPTTGLLPPLSDAMRRQLPDYERYMRGVGDLSAGLTTPAAEFARAWRRRLAIGEVEAFEQGYGTYSNYSHGTRVAGIAMRGLQRATLVPVRMTFSNDTPPPVLDEAAARRFAEMVRTAVGYMRSRGVRVCNISWGFTQADIESNLAQNGVEADAEARARRAAGIFEIMLAGMREAIAAAPDILFVVAAGNSRQDVDFTRDLPGSINLPNVLTVAAADERGRAASFATTGASVDLYARGTNILSVVPGGGRFRSSGASLAAPEVVNSAARLLGIDPALGSAELAQILIRSASPAIGGELPLLNPRAARAALIARQHSRGN